MYVCLVGKSKKKLKAIKREDLTNASFFRCYRADLSLDNDLRKLSERLERDFSKIDVLVHSAGVISLGRIEHSSIKDFDKHFSVNVRAPYYLTQRLIPLLRQSNGQVVFINSSVALRQASGGISQYIMTKYALRALADSLRDEVNSDGIRVITIYPGQTATPMQKKIYKVRGKKYQPECLLQPDNVAEALVSILALHQSAEITDVSIRPFRKPIE